MARVRDGTIFIRLVLGSKGSPCEHGNDLPDCVKGGECPG